MGARHCSVHLTVLYDKYSMGGAFDVYMYALRLLENNIVHKKKDVGMGLLV